MRPYISLRAMPSLIVIKRKKGLSTMFVGFGYDVHRLVRGRKLILGGVEISYPLGLEGHSDADVLCHAIADALLGAAGLDDIGTHFPDTDAQYKDISSLLLLEQVRDQVKGKRLRINNIDCTVVAEDVRILPHRDAMKQRLATALEIDTSLINIKGTTTEGLGYLGRGEAVAAHAVACLEPSPR